MWSDYDNWKTSPPENHAYDHLAERIWDMEAEDVLKECERRGIDVEGVAERELYETLIDVIAWHEEIL